MNRKLIIGIAIAILVVFIGGGLFIWSEMVKWKSPWGASPQDDFLITIEDGKTATDIAGMLVDKGVLHSSNAFLVVADLRGFADKLKAGEYMIRGASSPLELLDMFAKGYNYRHKLVVPEGFTQLDIAKRCEELTICTADEFLEECSLRNNMFPFVIVQAPNGIHAAIEGMLFPETYEFIRKTPAERVVNRMLTTFSNLWDKKLLPEAVPDPNHVDWWWYNPQANDRKRMHDVIVMASIIEKEAKHDEDRSKIASVFVNRIKAGMPLQSDATIHYLKSDWSSPVTSADREIDSPYNTYKNKGLPGAAICNPGEASLRAAMMPEKTDYLYFLTMENGEAKFASKYNDFLQLKKDMQRERRAE